MHILNREDLSPSSVTINGLPRDTDSERSLICKKKNEIDLDLKDKGNKTLK